ncbi:oligosaccharide flippase family protein [Qipengyuania sp. 6B39]|nr:oligosaccharide flippase family protein [Qipengyuania proteolytica]
MMASFFERFAPALATLLLAPIIGVEQTGIAAISLAAIFILAIPFKGVADVLTGARTLTSEASLAVLIAITAAGTLASAALMIGAPLVADLYNQPELARILPVHAIAIFAVATGTLHDGLFQREFRFSLQAKRKGVGGCLGILAGLVYAWFRPDAMALAVYHVTATVSSTLLCWAMFRPELGRQADWSWLRSHAASFAFQSASQSIGQITIRSIDLITGLILGLYAVGLIRVAMQLYNLISAILVTPLANVLTSHLAQLARSSSDHGRLQAPFLSLYRVLSFMALPLYGLIGAALPMAVSLAMSPEWETAGHLGAIVSANGLSAVLIMTSNSILIARGQYGANLAINAFQAILSIIATIVGAQFAIWGVAVSVVVRAYVSFLFVLLILHRYGGIRIRTILANTVPALFCTGIAVGVYYLIQSLWRLGGGTITELIVSLMCGAISYAAISAIVQRAAVATALSLFFRSADQG